MRILLAGGAGFVGSHLAARLLDQGHRVTIVDNLITGSAGALRSLELRYATAQLEIRLEDACWMSGLDGPIDAVLHLASPASPADYLRHPVEMFEAGASATRRLLEIACDKGARFLLGSTSELRGEPLVQARPEMGWEREDPVGPRSVHDDAKRYAEALAAAFARHRGTRVGIARFPDTYGPGMRIDDGRIIPEFVAQALRGEPLEVQANGSQVRSFCHVDDLVDGLLALLWSEIDGPVALDTPDEHSVLEVAELVIARTHSASALRQFQPAGEDPCVHRPPVECARRVPGWEPRTRLEDGLERTVRDIAARLGHREIVSGARAVAPSGGARSTRRDRVKRAARRGLETVAAGLALAAARAHGWSAPL